MKANARKKKADCIDVDVAALVSLRHDCVGCKGLNRCCCATYEICVTQAELRNIVGVMPQASRFCPHLKAGDGFDNVFERLERGLFSIDTTEEGLCLFAYHSDDGIRCSLHSTALMLDLPAIRLKPTACILWPLALSSGPSQFLSVHDDAFRFKCNSKRNAGGRRLCGAVGDLIESSFGAEFREQIQLAAANGLRRTTVPLHGPLAGGQ